MLDGETEAGGHSRVRYWANIKNIGWALGDRFDIKISFIATKQRKTWFNGDFKEANGNDIENERNINNMKEEE